MLSHHFLFYSIKLGNFILLTIEIPSTMKTFKQFKKIAYPMAQPHKVYNKGKVTNIPAGKAMAKRSSSSSGGDGA